MNGLTTVKTRIKKLLKLAQSSNPNEAQAALEKAKTLMSEHGLSEGECNEYVCESVKTTKRYSPYRAVIANVIGWLYGVFVTRNPKGGTYNFYGEKIHAFLAKEMYNYLVSSIDRTAKEKIREGAKLKYRNSFKTGMAAEINQRIRQQGHAVSWASEREQRSLQSKTWALSIIETKIEPQNKITALNKTAAARGLGFGASISLNRQTTGSGGRYLEDR